MQESRNINHDGSELTVWYHQTDGPAVKCHYCEDGGHQRLTVVEEVDKDGVSLSESDPIKIDAAKVFQSTMLHNRGLCQLGGECEDAFRADQEVSVSSTYG
jgi:hypothetical protein